MNKNNSILIKINNIEEIRKYASVVTRFESDINIYHNPKRYYDAKSILSVIALDLGYSRWIEILSDDEDEILEFKRAMKEFACKDNKQQ